ncbi:MAG: serine/threonine-protein kinase [Polyangiaceae bacterium]
MSAANGKICPTCSASYEPGVLFCPLDGAPLSSARNSDPLAESDPYIGLELEGGVRLITVLGVGSMGRVYRAFQAGIDRDVAVKVLHRELTRNRELVTRFHREAKIASRLVHPNVVQVLMTGSLPRDNTGEKGGELYLVMEYLDGLSLMSALAAASGTDGGALPMVRALHIVTQLCDAVGEAHAQGVVHRDLKPENIMLVRRGEDVDFVKVLDFGIARQDFAEPGATQAGLIFGTAKYISPEGAEGLRVGPPADVYSIATIFYQCLAGRTPFEGDAPMTLLMQQAQTAPPDLRDIDRASYVPDPIADLIMTNLSKVPTERSEDARAFRKELLAAARASGIALESFTGQARLLLDSKQRTRALDLSEEVGHAMRSPLMRASIPDDSIPPPRASSRPRSSQPSAPRISSARISAAPASEEAPAFGSGAADALAEPARRAPQKTIPFTPAADDDSFGDPPSEDDVGRASPDSMTMQGHMIPADRAADRGVHEAGPPSEQARSLRRTRAFWVALACFVVIVAPISVFGALRLFREAKAAEADVRDGRVDAIREAMASHAWDAPRGACVKDLTEAALREFPDDKRFQSLRVEAAERMLAEALDRRYAGAPAEALRIARLASEFAPALVAARRFAEDLGPEVAALRAGGTVRADDTEPARTSADDRRPPTRIPGPLPRDSAPTSSAPSASARASSAPAPSSSARPPPSAALPDQPPPLPADVPTQTPAPVKSAPWY